MHKSRQCGWIFVKSKENNNNNNNYKKNMLDKTKTSKLEEVTEKKSTFTSSKNIKILSTDKNKKKNNAHDKIEQKEYIEHNDESSANDSSNNMDYSDNSRNNSDGSDNGNYYEYDTDDINENLANEKNSFKKILCYNIIYNGSCKYGDKCLYAHSLEDQNINKNRKEVYDILKSNDDLSYINLRENYELYKTMIEMTKYCKNCNNNLCKGGYNCKSGVYDKKYCICINDLNYGFCHNYNCNFMHLSKRGLKPYYDEKNKKKINNNPLDINFLSKKTIDLLLYDNQKINAGNDIQLNLNVETNFAKNESESDISEIESLDSNANCKKEDENLDYTIYIETLCAQSIFD
jgi:Zinc finger C-x8-C-x5-C-x3-H type (and similar)